MPAKKPAHCARKPVLKLDGNGRHMLAESGVIVLHASTHAGRQWDVTQAKAEVKEVIGASVAGQYVKSVVRHRGSKKEGSWQFEARRASCSSCDWKAWARYTPSSCFLRI